MIRLVIADDDALVTMSLKTILESKDGIEVSAIGNSGSEAISLYRTCRPDVLLMDIRMEDMTGLEAAETVLREAPEAKILFLTTFSDDEYILKALEIGAAGYILKQDFDGIEAALIAVMEGQKVFGSAITDRLTRMVCSDSGFDPNACGITSKELEIIAEVAKGRSNKEIASALYLSEGTVRNYISGILLKLKLRDRTQLAVFYYENIKK